ncbi:hypothetical protein GCM10022377_17440 [Zhihengliuella alba]|uniref:Uncharacterized protein n=1 Tax=Zhihengliuella alba TaxID=547018 RepID=A0ABP7DH54_9MICC
MLPQAASDRTAAPAAVSVRADFSESFIDFSWARAERRAAMATDAAELEHGIVSKTPCRIESYTKGCLTWKRARGVGSSCDLFLTRGHISVTLVLCNWAE